MKQSDLFRQNAAHLAECARCTFATSEWNLHDVHWPMNRTGSTGVPYQSQPTRWPKSVETSVARRLQQAGARFRAATGGSTTETRFGGKQPGQTLWFLRPSPAKNLIKKPAGYQSSKPPP